MKTLLLISAGLLFLSLAPLPIGFYTLLRIVITIGAVAVIIQEIDNGLNTWVIIFGLIAILFNPIIPVYLGDKDVWVPIDIIAGILFSIKAFNLRKDTNAKSISREEQF